MTNLGLSASKFTEQGEFQKISSMFTTQSVYVSQSKDAMPVAEALCQPPGLVDEPGEEMFDSLNSSKTLGVNTTEMQSLRTSCYSVGKGSQLKQSEKDSLVSIKSFFTQTNTHEQKCKNDFLEQSEPVRFDPHVGCHVETEKTSFPDCDKPVVGFFATKMRTAVSSPEKVCDQGSNREPDEQIKNTIENLQVPTSSQTTAYCFNKNNTNDKTYTVSLDPTDSFTTHKDIEVEMKLRDNISIKKQDQNTSMVKRLVDMTPTTSSACDIQSSSHTNSSEDFMECDSCGEMIPIWEMPEHSDYHFALNLQKEVNKTQSVTSSTENILSGKRKNITGSGKRGRGGKKSKGGIRDKSVQPLTAFFSKS